MDRSIEKPENGIELKKKVKEDSTYWGEGTCSEPKENGIEGQKFERRDVLIGKSGKIGF